MGSSTDKYSLVFFIDEKLNSNVDIKDILQTLGSDFVVGLTWGVTHLEWYGNNLADFAKDESGEMIILSGKQLLELADKVYQTIDGLFIGYSDIKLAKDFLQKKWAYSDYFETSSAEVKIEIKQNWVINIEVRTKELAERISQNFQNVKIEDTVHLA
jgi:hypothetical protein